MYGQDARPYAIVVMLAAVASYVLVRAMAAEPGRRSRWLAGYAAAWPCWASWTSSACC